MNKNYTQRHELWLHVAFASFAINDQEIKSHLYDFSQIMFRHMKWLGNDILENGSDYNYSRTMQLYKTETTFEVLEALVLKIEAINYSDTALDNRIKTDDSYILDYIKTILSHTNNNQSITAFNMKREWLQKNLSQDQIDALTLFLFEESYKEYELILVYAYMQSRTQNIKEYNIYQDLIDESHFHLKSFCNMMAILGILALPRELHELTYVIKDVKKFIIDGIVEEEAAKIMCLELSEAIKDKELSKFFDFINFQESFHIELMKKLL